MAFEVDYAAVLQISQLTPNEKGELDRLFDHPDPPAKKVAGRGSEHRFVSSLGSKQVLWRRRNNDSPLILSVIDISYAA